MYYEAYERKPKRRRGRRRDRQRRGPGGCLGALLARLFALLALLVLGAGLLYALPPSLFAVEPEGVELSLTDGLPASRANVLLLGTDVMRQNSQRSDTVMIASVGYGKVKLTSVLRDTVVNIPGRGSDRVNAAYAYGGPELAMRTLNENFGLNIMHYAVVDFVALAEIVDAVGGVDIDITEEEMAQINRNVVLSYYVFHPLGYEATELRQYGARTHLDGLQALGYARIRKIDSDFRRASRQRVLLAALLEKIRANLWNPVLLARLGKALARSVDTNMSFVELLSLGEKALAAGSPETMRLPVDGSYTDNGATLKIDDWSINRSALRGFIYD